MRVALERVELRLARPIPTAHGELRARELLELRLTDADGVVGRGEAAPLEPYDGVSMDDVLGALAAYRPVLEAAGRGTAPGDLLDACRARAALPQALAAVDLALWDLAARREGQPVCRLLCAEPAAGVEVNATVTAPDRQGAAEEAATAARAGFRCVKLKVGIGDDAGRVAAVRAAIGPDVALRLDANGAWSVEEAVAMIAALAPARLELVEEPVHGLEATRLVRDRVDVPVAIDETAALPGALAAGAADAVCLKIGRCGGIGGLLAAAALVRASGAAAYVASTFDGPLGIAAGLHAAAALAPLPACGLATLGLFADLEDPFEVTDGAMTVPRGPGLLGPHRCGDR
ncbi:MAG: L-Ala-D/L-Glu epimerase [Solirubrobacteraceae bacterium]|jgi:o-succinylbenzoate synthase|nr:L-Ala-D/L-Glu epimerase [Solirubrobacteraceae bacterium]